MGAAGKALREEVAPVLIGLPQPEHAFDLQPVNPAGFRDILVSHRNIIITAIDGNLAEPAVTYERNRWAETQTGDQNYCSGFDKPGKKHQR